MKLSRKVFPRTVALASMPVRVVACRNRAPVWMWLKLAAILLIVPTFSWIALDLTPDWARDFAEHMATYGEHYEPYGYHLPPEVEKPQATRTVDAVTVDGLLSPPLIGILFPDHIAHDRPPPLCASPSHGLRAPPTLISA